MDLQQQDSTMQSASGNNPERVFKINFVSIILMLLIAIPFVFLVMKKKDVPGPEAELTMDQLLEKSKSDVQKNPTHTGYINLSLQFYKAGQYENCVTACREAIRLKPENPVAYNNMCSAYNALKKYDLAIEACNAALSLDPNFALAKTNLDYSIKSRKAESGK